MIENRHAQVAKAYILYREKESRQERQTLYCATIDMFDKYLTSADWAVKENANMQYSVAGLNNYVREAFTKHYWLNEVYPIIFEIYITVALYIYMI